MSTLCILVTFATPVLFVLTSYVAQAQSIHPDYQFTAVEVERIAALGPWPVDIPDDPGNELSGKSWAEALGKTLFRDTDLSGSGTIACISCHKQDRGFADSVVVAVGAGTHVRNTQGLLNAGLQHWFGWDGGADSLWAASLRPILSELEMAGSITNTATRFRTKPYVLKALSRVEIDSEKLTDEQLLVWLAKAIGAYTRTLLSPLTAFDQFRSALLIEDYTAMQKYSESSARGLKIFIGDANCHICHFGPNFSNGEFHDIGRPFFTAVGQVDSGRYDGIKRVREDKYNLTGVFNQSADVQGRRKTQTVKIGQMNFGQWRTPSLRNLTLTAPYMHDGSLATLRDVVDYYADINPERLHAKGESILRPLNLDDSARNDLVNFLKSLSSVAE